ncbi:cytochrome c oxidase accessory protein CcoG [Capnocytophaga canis]|uniref:cytochrome c oxidase accessory protein CcoG n=1 Tax=Capnocytophaga TaxID=1016 RepID=UPI000BB1A812|nr:MULTISPECIES: cytochrome c oxidase accessory protein CcoG [unclassified Capnocytophaga]ATA72173.1 cytochrome c oxidase accessory protein CcoG [Capnocytophaga sp. H4358]ATA74293.1 cytochrome c oxidase accessory protein CcoG [Capnocytophaga sp. H2931]
MEEQDKEIFRDSIGTIDKEGKRAWVFPKKPSGRFYRYRKYVSYVLLIFLLVSPWVKINGNQFLLFNILDRKFNIFGLPFWPQDFYLFVISMIIGVVFLALFTVVFGRIFCGWICPQTIFMEMVFRRIEYWIEGDRGSQMRLDKQAWDKEKIRKKTLKWSLFFLISFSVANTFLAYLIGSDVLLTYIKEGPINHWGTFIALFIFTCIFYFIFTWFREQVCIIACPYGRLQGVLLDNRSIIVAYDYVRGESDNGRKKFRKNEDRQALGHGDCIDCMQCVHVCPTGIDIRNGTQLECVNCTACIDACDEVMDKVGFKRGLIRFASEENIAKKAPFKFDLRMKGYTAVLTILIGILIGMLFIRTDVQADILRLPGQLYQHEENGVISNVYTYKIINKTTRDFENVTVKVVGSLDAEVVIVGKNSIFVPKQGLAEGTLFVRIKESSLKEEKLKVLLEVYSNGNKIGSTKTIFLGPRTFR